MVGGLYNPDAMKDQIAISLVPYGLFTDDNFKYDSKTYSAFGQAVLTPVEHFELDAGLRYTSVSKASRHFPPAPTCRRQSPDSSCRASAMIPAMFRLTAIRSRSFPTARRTIMSMTYRLEFTLSYRPTDDFTAFVSYKQGYKGPAFYVGTESFGYHPGDLVAFHGEKVKGVEGGIKTRQFDDHLNISMAAYDYKYRNLQVASVSTVNDVVHVNSADAKIYGVELKADYQVPAISGLTLKSEVDYNHGNYTRFPTAACYGNETVAEGCVGGVQNLPASSSSVRRAGLATSASITPRRSRASTARSLTAPSATPAAPTWCPSTTPMAIRRVTLCSTPACASASWMVRGNWPSSAAT